MTENEKDYSDYVQHTISLYHGQQFVLGFLLTVFAIVLTQLPDPSAFRAQVALFFFSVLLSLIQFLSFDFAVRPIYYCRKVPPVTKHLNALSTLAFLASELITGVTPVLFALWNLPYLAIASGLSSLFFAIACFIFVIRPFRKWRKTVS